MKLSEGSSLGLSPTKRALRRVMLQKEGVTRTGGVDKIPKASTSDLIPASFAQQRLWFLNELEPGQSIYNIATAFHVSGRLDTQALDQSLTEIVRRHAVLRTTFALVAGEPMQAISEPQPVSLPLTDLSHLTAPERELKARQEAAAEARQVFDLRTGPLWRARLLKLDYEEHDFLLTLHHIISDGWSLGLFFKELSILYDAYSRGEQSPLEELDVQYADYSVWQREWLKGTVLEEQLSYWKQQLKGAPPVLELPSDRPRKAAPSYKGATEIFRLPSELSQQLKSISQCEGATLYMTLLAAFQIFLSRYTGQEDIVVGTTYAGREREEVQPLIGFFVNTLVLRAELSGHLTFVEVLQRVREIVLNAHANQDLPFEKLVEELQPERSLGYQPLFQVIFQLQKAARELMRLEGLQCSELRREGGDASKFDLVLSMSETEADLSGSIEYKTDLFDRDMIQRLIGHYTTLLSSIVANPHQAISKMALIGEAEREQLLSGFNETTREYPRTTCIHHLFEEQVERTPEAIALITESEQLSYRELNERANQLAHYLQEQGIGAESVVAILMQRSTEMVVSLLAVLKAGGCYLPLDPDYPIERLQLMLEDAAAALVLTQDRLAILVAQGQCQTICLDADREAIEQRSALRVTSQVKAENLSHLIYTSGSTGRPKGVAINHYSAVMMLRWARATFRPRQLAGVLFSTSICFDLSVFELFAPLSCGGMVILAANVLQLPRLRAGGRVTLINTVPSAMAELVRSQEVPPSVQVVNLAGEALSRQLVEAVYALPQVAEVWNLYGPTEDTTYSTAALVERGAEGVPGIGRPLAGGRALVLDSQMELVASGVVGELYLGGEGLARGYQGQAALTAGRFVPDPWSREGGERLYRTGDLARWRADGELEYLGRRDYQVKVRGFRIELGEIEAALCSHHLVRDAVVMALEDEGRDKRLIAYVVATEPNLKAATLRHHLKERLPQYMLPAAFVFLEHLPLTLNGKVDRQKLPPPSQAGALAEQCGSEQTPIQEMLSAIWCQLLRVAEVGLHDNFFELGGHSLLAMRLMSRVSELFRVELPLRTLFDQPTVAALAEQVVAAEGLRHSTQPLQRVSREEPLPLSFAQQRLWFFDQLEPGHSFYNIAWGRSLRGALNPTALGRSLTEIVRRHESLRTSFQVIGTEPRQVISEPQPVEIAVTDLSHLAAEERAAAAAQQAQAEAQQGFDLTRSPLMRVRLIKLAPEEQILCLTLHHIISDGWSLGILWRELSTLYNSYLKGEESPLEELPIQYADYSAWQRESLDGEVLAEQLSYWREQLKGAPALLELPTDRPRPPVQSYRGATARFSFSPELSGKLQALSQREGVTLFMTLLAAFQLLLSRWSGQEEIVIGTPIAGRSRRETEKLIGFFVNTLALRADLSGNPSFVQLLARTRELSLAAYAHQELPFERVVEELAPERSLSYSPLFQVMFQLLKATGSAAPLEGLTTEAVTQEPDVTKFDLTLSVVEASEGLQGTIEYNRELYEAEMIGRLIGHYRRLLESAITDLHRPVRKLPLLGEAEREQLLSGFNETAREYPRTTCIHHLFEEQVERTPEAIALITESEQLSYRELNERANQLAHYLQEQGIGAERVVAILVPRSVEMVVSVLGVLKAGGAYLPLDTTYPTERLRLMLKDSGAPVMLASGAMADVLPEVTEGGGVRLVRLDAQAEQIQRCSAEPVTSGVKAENLAYVIYTSGSTGRPKGVCITHASVANFVTAIGEACAISAGDRLLQFASLSFDASVEEIFTCLTRGTTLVLRTETMITSAARFLSTCEEQRITVLDLPTAYWHELTTQLATERLRVPDSIRVILIGGEKALPERLALWHQCVDSAVRLVNHYGPTETTVAATICDLTRVDEAERACEVAIGGAISNVRLYVLDDEGELLPAGAAGELYIGGAGLGRGYLNLPALTAERFVPDPFSAEGGERLYRTGDRVRYRRDGRLQYLGRTDDQVKIRGFRIELGEIEATLAEHGAVRDAVVAVRERADGDKQLVAYLVPGETELKMGELREWLTERLPGFMIPASFLKLEELPLTPAGKIDRRALASLDVELINERPYEAPHTEMEKTLASIWADLLKVERVGINDNFFELGGHSLLATRMTTRVRETYRIELPLRSVFEAPTIALLGNRLEKLKGMPEQGEIVRIQASPRGEGDLQQLLSKIAQLSEEEVRGMLTKEGQL